MMKRILSLLLSSVIIASGMITAFASESETVSDTASESDEAAETTVSDSESVEQTDAETEPEAEPEETDAESEPETEPEETDAETEPETVPEETDAETEPETEPEETEAETEGEKYYLSYEKNLDSAYGDIDGEFSVPEKTAGVLETHWEVADIHTEDQIYSVKDTKTYLLHFEGWNTAADGSGEHYDPGEVIEVKENTVLYAVWTYELLPGQIVLSIDVILPDGVQAPEADEFEVEVSGDAETAIFKLLGADGSEYDPETVDFPITVTLKRGETAIIETVPGDYTVCRAPVDNYAFEEGEDAATVHDDDISVEVSSLSDTEVVYNYYYIEPLGTVTVSLNDIGDAALFTIEGVSETNDHIGFVFTVPAGQDSVTITDLPIGDYIVSFNSDWNIRYTTEEGYLACELGGMGDEGACDFNIVRSSIVYWLIGDAYVSELFDKPEEEI